MSYIPNKLAIPIGTLCSLLFAKIFKVEKSIVNRGDEFQTSTYVHEPYEKEANEIIVVNDGSKEIIQKVLTFKNEDIYFEKQREKFFTSIKFIKIIHFLNGLKLISTGFSLDSDKYDHTQNNSREFLYDIIEKSFSIKKDSFRNRFNEDYFDSELINRVEEKFNNLDDFLFFEDENHIKYIKEFISKFKDHKLLKANKLTEDQICLLTLQLFQQFSKPESPIVYLNESDIDDLKIIRKYLIEFDEK